MGCQLMSFKVAILVADGVEFDQITKSKKALKQTGAIPVIVSPNKIEVKGWKNKKWKGTFLVDMQVKKAKAKEFDALLLPGGVMSPDALRMDPKAIQFVKKFAKLGKPIAAICQGSRTLIDAKAIKGKTVTSAASIKIDLIHAGAKWRNQQVVKDKNLITSRQHADIPAFNDAMIALFAHHKKNRKN
jgi:protease I